MLGIVVVVGVAFFAGKSAGIKEKGKNVTKEEKRGVEKEGEAGTTEQEKQKESMSMAEEQNTETQEQTEVPKEVVISYKCSNTWEQENMICTQIDVTIVNETKEEAKDWKAVLTIPEKSKILQSWNAELTVSGTTLMAKGVEYNNSIPAESNITYGFIIQTRETFVPIKGMVKVGDKQYEMAPQGFHKQEAGEKTTEEHKTIEETTESQMGIEQTTEAGEGVMAVSNQIKAHGKLSVKGSTLTDAKGKPFRLKGISTHGIAWFPQYISRESFASLKKLFGINAVRLALYSDPNAGYTKELHKKVRDGVEAATKEGMYVIIDWHILSDGNPNIYKEQAKEFFKEMAQAYKNQDNIIYEICNEPNGGAAWENDIKPYAVELISIIRKIDKDAVIIVGTPNWSQDVDIVAQSPITGEKNIMYALHFYAATHKEDLRSKGDAALKKGLPLFVSEFSICEASGNGNLDYNSADAWAAFCKSNNISMMAWNLSNKAEASSLLKPSCSKVNSYQESDLSDAGIWFKNLR